jgi:hypothetical protein
MRDYFLVEYRPELGTFLSVVFGIASFIGVIGAASGANPLPGPLSAFQDIVNAFGLWVNWLAIAGIIGFIVAIWWMIDYVLKIRKLKDLMDTESKSKFIKSMDDIDFIAWRLPKKYKNLVANKKSELKITQ